MTVLATKRLFLRPLDHGDLPALEAIFADREHMWVPGRSNDAAELAQYYLDRSQSAFARYRVGMWGMRPRSGAEEPILGYTGCRFSEIRTLMWQEVGVGTLDLSDSKTGPRTVYLNSKAREVIERQQRTDSAYVFPSPASLSRPVSRTLSLWYLVRTRAGIEDVRLHDLRHSFASWAVMRGVPLPTVAKLLGHRQVSMTLRYAHVHDKDVEAAAERVGSVITSIWDLSGS